MSELISLLGVAQNSGGLLLLMAWMVFKLTVIEHDFKTHIKFFHNDEED